MAPIHAPVPLADMHRLDDFQNTSSELTAWLLRRARKNEHDGASRCFVTCDEADNVVGYYALAAGSVSHEQVPGRVRRNMPDPIPIAVLARLAVHTDWMGQGIGRGLLKDAALRTLRAAQEVGIRALLCHAIDEPAKRFYVHHGFVASPIHPLTLMLNFGLVSGRSGKELGAQTSPVPRARRSGR